MSSSTGWGQATPQGGAQGGKRGEAGCSGRPAPSRLLRPSAAQRVVGAMAHGGNAGGRSPPVLVIRVDGGPAAWQALQSILGQGGAPASTVVSGTTLPGRDFVDRRAGRERVAHCGVEFTARLVDASQPGAVPHMKVLAILGVALTGAATLYSCCSAPGVCRQRSGLSGLRGPRCGVTCRSPRRLRLGRRWPLGWPVFRPPAPPGAVRQALWAAIEEEALRSGTRQSEHGRTAAACPGGALSLTPSLAALTVRQAAGFGGTPGGGEDAQRFDLDAALDEVIPDARGGVPPTRRTRSGFDPEEALTALLAEASPGVAVPSRVQPADARLVGGDARFTTPPTCRRDLAGAGTWELGPLAGPMARSRSPACRRSAQPRGGRGLLAGAAEGAATTAAREQGTEVRSASADSQDGVGGSGASTWGPAPGSAADCPRAQPTAARGRRRPWSCLLQRRACSGCRTRCRRQRYAALLPRLIPRSPAIAHWRRAPPRV